MDNSFTAELISAIGRDLKARLQPRTPSLHIKLYVERLWLAEFVRAQTQAGDRDRIADAQSAETVPEVVRPERSAA